jgi:hypothetical protein
MIIIFGGKTDTITIADMYTLNLRSKEWKVVEVKSIINPKPRYGACMESAGGYIFIYGGITDIGHSNELWMFDPGSSSYTLIKTSGDTPPQSARGSCKAYLSENQEIIFETYMGESKNGLPISSVYRYYHSTKSWKKVRPSLQSDIFTRTAAAAYLINDLLLVAGGREWEYVAHVDAFVLNITDSSYPQTALNSIFLPEFTYNAASVYYKNKLYIQGGAASYGYLPMHDIPKNQLIVIEMDDECDVLPGLCEKTCSRGTYYADNTCKSCPVGTFSDKIGSTECEKCRIGHYSDTKGADSIRFCKYCDSGFYTTEPGQSYCLACPSDGSCYEDGVQAILNSQISHEAISTQPELLENHETAVEQYTHYFNLTISVLSTIVILILFNFYRTRRVIKNLDLYSIQHNYKENEKMIIRKTFLGGVSSLVLVIVGMSIVFSMTINQAINNILETKTLVPLMSLENEYKYVRFI